LKLNEATHICYPNTLASIVLSDADLELALPAVFFGSIGTAGQRCTSTRRLFLQRSIAPAFIDRLQTAYTSLRPGDPLDPRTLLGPLHTEKATSTYTEAITSLRSSGAEILAGGGFFDASQCDDGDLARGFYVRPTIAQPASTDHSQALWSKEIFAPILKIAVFDDLEEAIELNNAVPQGLSSSLWTRDIRNIGRWTGPAGSDCGIVNVRHFTVSRPHAQTMSGCR
jgi:aldehyde dehydrogenase family 7 member A1